MAILRFRLPTTSSSLPERQRVPAMRTFPDSLPACILRKNYSSWVAGAFDSSWRAVYQFLIAFQSQYGPEYMKKFLTIWGTSEYWDDDTLQNHTKVAVHLNNLAQKKK
jgi:hypothetical protein